VFSTKKTTPYENLAKTLRLPVRQLEQFNKTVMAVDVMELYDLVDKIQSLVLDVTAPDSQ